MQKGKVFTYRSFRENNCFLTLTRSNKIERNKLWIHFSSRCYAFVNTPVNKPLIKLLRVLGSRKQ